MYRGRFWTMRQYAGFATAEETNQRFRYLLDQGQTGLSVAFDLPTQMGYDSDAPEAEGEVGRVGVPISSLADMEVLLDGIPLGEVSTSMTINATAPILLALYVAAAEAQGVPRSRDRGHHPERHPQGVHRPRHVHLPAAAVDAPGHRRLRVLRRRAARSGTRSRSAATTCARPGRRPPRSSPSRWPTRSPTSTPPSPGASTSTPSPAGCRSSSPPGRELFEEVAKFRVARRMWATIMKERFGAKDPRSMVCRFHAQTAGSSLTAQSVDNNVVRVTIQALAAVLGGAQSLHTNSRDEALALPTEEAARLALRTQQMIAHEAGVTETPDPLAGSYFVESLTNELEAAAWAYLDEIEEMGGTLAAIEGGYQQRQIQEAAYRVQRAIESGDQVVVGVNRFRDDEVSTPALHRIDPDGERRQIERVRRVRAERPAEAWTEAMDRLEATARGDGNLMPPSCLPSVPTRRWGRSAIACGSRGASTASSSRSDR